jgi:hypothetical protein
MGGVAGHLAHLYDNRDLTYNKMAEILRTAAAGELIGTEKTDGYNIYLGFVDGKARAARNKGDMKKGGMTMDDLKARKFQGGARARNAYVKAFEAYEKAITSLSDQERLEIFGPDGAIFYNTEIQGPMAANVVNYDENIVSIHGMGHKRYNKSTDTLDIIDVQQQSQILDHIIDRFEQITAGDDFKIKRTAFLTLNQITDEAFVEATLRRIQDAGYRGDMTIDDYLATKIRPVIDQSFDHLEERKKEELLDRILQKDKAPGIPQIAKGLPAATKSKISAFVKSSKVLIQDAIWPIELAIHDFAVKLLQGVNSAYILDNRQEVERLKEETASAIRAIESYDGPESDEAHRILVKQLKKLKKHENIDTVVEGFVFQHDGQMYKFTGNFAPMNQLLGLFKYGRGKIPKLVKESILEQNEGHNNKRIIAIYPGRFQPMGQHHVNVYNSIQQEYGRGNTFLVTSDATDYTAKEGVPKSPFTFDEKKMIAMAHGIPAQNVVKVKNPYNAKEILKHYDPEETEVVYFVGQKDMREGDPRFKKTQGTTADGYDWQIRVIEHEEVDMPATFPYGEMSGTNLRKALKQSDQVDFEDIMGFDDPEIYQIIKSRLGAEMPEPVPLAEETQTFLGIFRGIADELLEEKAKVSKAGKKRVSKKIPILKDEGYPTKQAIAIAHSMEEKGKLEETEEESEDASNDKNTPAGSIRFIAGKSPTGFRIARDKRDMRRGGYELQALLDYWMEHGLSEDMVQYYKDAFSQLELEDIPERLWLDVEYEPSTGKLKYYSRGLPYIREEELEEISAMSAGSVAGGSTGTEKRKRRDDEVNEVLNYLLQKLGE